MSGRLSRTEILKELYALKDYISDTEHRDTTEVTSLIAAVDKIIEGI